MQLETCLMSLRGLQVWPDAGRGIPAHMLVCINQCLCLTTAVESHGCIRDEASTATCYAGTRYSAWCSTWDLLG